MVMWKAKLRPSILASIAILAILLIFPLLAPSYLVYLLSTALVFSILALGFNVLLKGVGLLSFGHAAFFGFGAYTAAFLMRVGIQSMEVVWLVSAAASAAIAAAIGPIAVKYTKIFFALVTLAFAQVIYSLFLKLYQYTGGTDGISVGIPTLLWLSFGTDRTAFLSYFYYYILAMLIATIAASWFIYNSNFGLTLSAVRENPLRAEFVGVKITRYRFYAFVISGFISGLAGSLLAPLNGHVSPELLYWTLSGDVMVMTLLGGYKFLLGPIIGAIIYQFVRSYMLTVTAFYWQLAVGIIIILLSLFFRGGIAGIISQMMTKEGKGEKGL